MNLPESYKKYFMVILFIVLVYLSYLLLKPFLLGILTSAVLVYLLYPIYRLLNKVIKNKNACSLLMLLLVLVVIFLPSFYIIKILVSESGALLGNIGSIDFSFGGYVNSDTIQDISSKVIVFIYEKISLFLLSIPSILLNIIIMLFVMFFLFKHGNKMHVFLIKFIPVKKSLRDRLIKRFEEVSYALVYGIIFIALLEGILATFGFYFFNYLGLTSIKFPFFWGFIIFILSLLPVLGPPLVWVPLAIYLYSTGNIIAAIILVVYFGVLFSLILDTIVKNKIIGNRAKIHPVLILLGVLGGLGLFGFVGIVIGPVILASLLVLLEFYFR